MSYADHARRFLDARRSGTGTGGTGNEINERNEERVAPTPRVDADPELAQMAAAIAAFTPAERGRSDDEGPGPTAVGDGWDRSMRDSYAPIRHATPAGCLGPRVCARIGPCERHAAGRPCLLEGVPA